MTKCILGYLLNVVSTLQEKCQALSKLERCTVPCGFDVLLDQNTTLAMVSQDQSQNEAYRPASRYENSALGQDLDCSDLFHGAAFARLSEKIC